MRKARIKLKKNDGYYHLYNRIAGMPGDLPFGDVEKEKFIRIIRFEIHRDPFK